MRAAVAKARNFVGWFAAALARCVLLHLCLCVWRDPGDVVATMTIAGLPKPVAGETSIGGTPAGLAPFTVRGLAPAACVGKLLSLRSVS